MRIAVIGAANVDIGGFSTGAARMHDSNPGRVHMSVGGVGRNIAANLALLGADTELITAIGGDDRAKMLVDDLKHMGIRLNHAVSFPDAATSTYLYIADNDGDMLLAVNDMAMLDRMTPEKLSAIPEAIADCDVAVLEANLPVDTLRFLGENLTVPLVADAVSAAKAERLKGVLPYLTALKPNRIEAEILTGRKINGRDDARLAAEQLVSMGVQHVFLTVGEQGVCVADASGSVFLKTQMRPMINATGAGDAFTAAIAWSTAKKWNLIQTASAGMAAAIVAVESREAVNMEMSEALLLKRISELGIC